MFKKGDKVRCMEVSGTDGLTLGKVYTVVDTGAFPDAVRVLDDDEDEWDYRGSRFELVDDNDRLDIDNINNLEYIGKL